MPFRVPAATYRLQFNLDFRFDDADRLAPYLKRLGISDVYASPILQARSGSSHGYDVTDPTRINTELGGRDAFDRLTDALRRRGMGLLLDIVPNHMAASHENPWWMDVLEKGRGSPYAGFFDIDWEAGWGKIVLPYLGKPMEEALGAGEISLAMLDKRLFIRYHDQRFPVNARSRAEVMRRAGLGPAPGQDRQISFAELQEEPGARARLEQAVSDLNNFTGKNAPLEVIIREQCYRLVHWRSGMAEINYRRFFDISTLVGVREEDPAVFEATHRLILDLVRRGKVTGLRVDHIDGLRGPREYLERLQKSAGENQFYIIVEKILAGGESPPADWPVSGTTGYDFLNKLNGLFVDKPGLEALKAFHARFAGSSAIQEDVIFNSKKQVMRELFPAETASLAALAAGLPGCPAGAGIGSLRDAIIEVTAGLPVYRTYISGSAGESDRNHLRTAFERAAAAGADGDGVGFLRQVLSQDFPPGFAGEQKADWLDFVKRWQQLTGAVMAKGYEDTALYNYSALSSLNEVGSGLGEGAVSVEEFHEFSESRRRGWPAAMNCTSTHDTKRSEDVRARLNVLSEIPKEWEDRVNRWQDSNKGKLGNAKGLRVPGPDMEMLIYQTLLGAWPLSPDEVPGFLERIADYLRKAAREAKRFTNWLSPDLEYEEALIDFVRSILRPGPGNEFLADFLDFEDKVAFYGALNSLAQVVIKCASPGVPDFYQGMEIWDLDLVDPDTRHPVNFEHRVQLLKEIARRDSVPELFDELAESWRDGRIKLYTTWRCLAAREARASLVAGADYLPVRVEGPLSGHVIAFARRRGGEWALAAAPRFIARLGGPGKMPAGRAWEGNALVVPGDSPVSWTNIFTGEVIDLPEGASGLKADQVFARFPVALLTGIGHQRT